MKKENETNVTLPKLILTTKQWREIKWLVDKCSQEISGMGTVIIDEDDNFRVEKLFLLKQECTSVATDLDASAVSKALYEARDCKGQMSLWWHSHVNMPASFSPQDVLTIKEHGANGFMIGLVVNKSGDYSCAIGTSKPKFYIDGLTMEVEEEEDKELTERLEKEFTDKVTFKTIPVWNGRSDYNYGYDSAWGADVDDSFVPAQVWSVEQNKYIDNPDYVKKLEERMNKSSKDDRRSLQNAQRENDFKKREEKYEKAFEALTFEQLKTVKRIYEDYNGVATKDHEELKDFFVSYAIMNEDDRKGEKNGK